MATQLLPAGVYAALATPFDAEGALDGAGLERLVAHVIAGGADGISPVGSTGEGARLTREQRLDVVRRVRSLVPDDRPVIAGAPLFDVAGGLAELAELADAGADAALVSPQSGYPLSDDDVLRFFDGLAERSPLPLVLYNIPAYTGVRIAIDVVGRLAEHRSVIGIKDSSRDMEYLQGVVFATSDASFGVFTGTDTLLAASLAAGADGEIAASVNLVPELATAVYRAFTSGDLATARREQARLFRVVTACRRGPAPAGWKAALSVAGICEGYLASPGSTLPDPMRDELARTLTELGVVP
jgi:4-hydroxy-tetrahydrodipicolinate synthase